MTATHLYKFNVLILPAICGGSEGLKLAGFFGMMIGVFVGASVGVFNFLANRVALRSYRSRFNSDQKQESVTRRSGCLDEILLVALVLWAAVSNVGTMFITDAIIQYVK